MKQADPGAGKPLKNFGRRRLLQAGLAGILLSAIGAEAAPGALISPAGHHVGASIMRRVDPQGLPDMRGDTFGPMTLFVYPVAVAAGPFDIFIADAGLGALFRFDPALEAMMAVPGVQVTQQTRLAAGPDGSVLVAEGRLGVARRYARNGRLLQTIDPRNTGSRYDDILMDPGSGRYFGLDLIQRRIEEVHPQGGAASILPSEVLPLYPTAIALDERTLYAAGQDCRCITAVDLLNRRGQVVADDLVEIAAMTAGDGWLVVADSAERLLRIYRNGALRGEAPYQSLNLFNPQGLSIARGTLYVADPGSRQIAIFRLRP